MGESMSIRNQIAEAAKVLKEEKGYSYTRLCNDADMTRKQISAILHGSKGVSIEAIEAFFKDAFDENLIVVISKDLYKK